MPFSGDKIGIGNIVRNYLSISLLTKFVLHMACFRVDYGELLTIIKVYITGSSLGDRIVLENDSIRAINILTYNDEDIFELSFRTSINVSSRFHLLFPCLQVRKQSDSSLLAKADLISDVTQIWTKTSHIMYHLLACLILIIYNTIFFKKITIINHH